MSPDLAEIDWTIIALIILYGIPFTFFFMSIFASWYNRGRRIKTLERKYGKIRRVLFDITVFQWLFIVEIEKTEVGLHRDQFEFLDP
jgi:hypothetical protein